METNRNRHFQQGWRVCVAGLTFSMLLSVAALAQTYDLSQDFSIAANPNGVWSYGAKGSLAGSFSLLTFPQTQNVQAGIVIQSWLWANSQQPIIARNSGTTTWTIASGQGVFPPGTVMLDCGTDGSPQNFAVVRFTVPANGAGSYQLQTSVRSKYDGGLSADSDFHVVQNGVEIFVKFMPPNSGTGYTNTLALAPGDTIDLMVGRGADGVQSASGLKVQASLTFQNSSPVPSILAQPASQSVTTGSNVTFTVTASGAAPLSYQWRLGEVAIDGATNSSLTLSNVQPTDAGSYSVVVTNGFGASTSSNAVLSVHPPAYDLSADFSLASNPNGVWGYGAKGSIGGAFSLLTYPQTQNVDAGVVMQSWLWAGGQQPIIARNSGSATWYLGGSGVFPPGTVICDSGTDDSPQNFVVIRFTVPPGGAGSYQLQTSARSKYDGGLSADSDFHVVQNGVEIFGKFMAPNSGTGYTNTLALAPGDTIDLMVGRGADGTQYASGLKVQASLTLNSTSGPPAILVQPQSESVMVSSKVTFSVFANGPTPLAYQWRLGEVAIDGATNSSLTLGNVQLTDAGSYSVIVTNSFGAVTSSNAVLSVDPAPIPATYDLSRDFSLAANPNGVWSYGAEGSIGGSFSLLAYPQTQNVGLGVVMQSWLWAGGQQPVIARNSGSATWYLGGSGVFPPGTVICDSGTDDSPQNFAVIRFTVPPGAAGSYELQTSARSKYDGGLSEDSDFHVVQNGLELFGQFMPPNSGTGYTNTLALSVGDTIDLMVGRGADGRQYASGMKVQASLTLTSTDLPPSILRQPQSQTAIEGANVTLRVIATGSAPLSYLWFFGSDAIAGATNSSLTLTSVQTAQTGAYSLVVSNAINSVTSDPATLTVNPAPDCAPQPDGLVAWWGFDGSGDDLAGSSGMGFSGPAQYCLGEAGQALFLHGYSGQVAASPVLNVGASVGLSIEAWLNPSDASRLMDVVEWNNHAGSIGAHFALSVPNSYGGGVGCLFGNLVDTAGISHQVTSVPGLLASGVFQHVALTYEKASGSAALYLNGVRVAITNLGVFTPQTTYDLFVGVRPSGPISGIAFDGSIDELSLYNRALSPVEIQAVFNAGLSGKCRVPKPPVILSQPKDVAAYPDGSASFQVIASGTGPLTYLWFFGSDALSGATNSALDLKGVQAAQAGAYSVVISNTTGSVTSELAVLTLNPVPSCSSQPDGLVAWWGLDGNADDLAGTSALGFSGAPQYGEGQVGQALLLHGYSGQATASGALNVGPSSGLSIETWINPSNASRLADIVEWNNRVGSIGTHLAISVPNSYGGGPGCLFANLVDTAGISHQVTSVPGLLASGVFQHIALTYDKATGLAALYLNGSRVALTNLGTFTPQTTYDLFVGARPSGPIAGIQFEGSIDELSLYNRALSEADIQAVYNASISGKCKVARPPVILSQPQNVVSYVGGSATFHVAAGGTAPLTYLWFFNTAAIPDATNSTLVVVGVQAPQAGAYSVVVSNSVGSVPSDSANLTVNAIPSCAPEPDGLVALWSFDGSGEDAVGANAFALYGSSGFVEAEVGQGLVLNGANAYGKANASPSLNIGLGSGLTIEAWINPSNVGPLADILEWNTGHGEIGAHLALSVPTSFGGGAGSIYANIIDTWGVSHQITTDPGLLASHVFQHLALTYDRASGLAFIYLNGNQVAAASLGSFTPQTSYDLYLGKRPSGPLSGEWFGGILDELTLYSRALSAPEVQAIAAAALGGKCKTAFPPVIISNPQNLVSVQGGIAAFTVTVSGTRPLNYQWQFGSNPIPEATNATLVVSNVQPAQAGSYWVTVSNAVGSAASSPAILTVQVPNQVGPAILVQPVGATVPIGSDALLSVVATGPEPLSYQWFWNDSAVMDATNRSLLLAQAQPNQGGAYQVAVSNPFGSVTSTVVVVSINDYQGGAVYFANAFGSVRAYVFDVDGLTRLEGNGYLAQLYAGTNETTLMPIGAATPFKTGISAGLFVGGTRYISAVPPGGLATVQVRAWDAAAGSTFEQASLNGGRAGLSLTFTAHTAGGIPPAPPTWLLGLQSFSLQSNTLSQVLTNAPSGDSSPPVLLDPQLMADTSPQPQAGLAAQRGAGPKAAQPANRQFHFTIWAEVGKTYVIESSTNLHTWQPVTNVFNTVGPFQISDPASTATPRRFYRVRTQH